MVEMLRRVERAPLAARVAVGLVTLYLLWGSTFLAIRVAVDTIPPLTAAGLRWILAGAVLYPFARPTGGSTWREWAHSAALAVLMVTASNGFVTWAETRVASGIASLGIATVAPWLVLLEAVRPGGRRPTAATLAGVALGIAGVASLADPAAPVDGIGMLALLAAAFAFALGTTITRVRPVPGSAVASTGRQMLAGGVQLLALGLVTGEAPWTADPSTSSVVALAWLALSGSIAGFTLYTWLVRSAPPAVVGTYSCANPVVALALGAWWLGEPVTPRTVVAATLVIAGVGLVVLGPTGTGPLRRGVDWLAAKVYARPGGAADGTDHRGPGGLVDRSRSSAAQAR